MSDVDDLAGAVLGGERRALARAITLIESTRADHQARAQALLAALLPKTGGALRIGISGAPGVGKSSFIETFGLYPIEAGQRIAVLAVDPSSKRSGGALLGDKTRMAELVRDPAAFIRPSPAGETLVCNRERNTDVFHAAIGGFGMLGVFVELRIALKKVSSGRMLITAIATKDLEETLTCMEEQRAEADYLVGWLDLYAGDKGLGRGAIHRADHVPLLTSP